MAQDSFAIRIAGKTGEGIDFAGDLLASVAAGLGFHVYGYRRFPTRIRGGYSAYDVRMGSRRLLARPDQIDVLIAFDRRSVDASVRQMGETATTIYDSTTCELHASEVSGALYPVPLTALAKASGDGSGKNVVALGVLAHLLDIDLEHLDQALRRRLMAKGDTAIQANKRAALAGWNYAKEKFVGSLAQTLPRPVGAPKLLLTGNEAVAFGALVAGCRFFAGYPITPATSIMEWLAEKLPAHGGVAIQVEDELAAINMAIGASYAGVRAMTATSGPGLSLMAEGLGLASMSETPVVVVNVQRVGPATGLPTRHEQSDLESAIYGSHGDALKLILAPETVEACFYETVEAFNLADRYQCPVILLLDQALGLSEQTVDGLDVAGVKVAREGLLGQAELDSRETFARYALAESGISARFAPPKSGQVLVTSSLEHTETGFYTDDPAVRARMAAKRQHKLRNIWSDTQVLHVRGDGDSEVAAVSLGSTYGATLEAVELLAAEGTQIKLVCLNRLWPLAVDQVRQALGAARRVFVVECNVQGQLTRLLAGALPTTTTLRSICKYDGMPFTPMEVYRALREAM